MGENSAEPLAKTRSRRSNAGARMHEMMFAAEDDELFAAAFGGSLKPDEDSSEDEEYVPKDLDIDGRVTDRSAVDAEDEDGSASDDGDSGDSGSDEEDEDEEEDEEEEDDEDRNEDHDECSHLNNCDIDNLVMEEKFDSRNHSLIKREQVPSGQRTETRPGSPSKAAYRSCAKICTVCLGEESDEDDEIIECDACGVTVHENCYGVSPDENAQGSESERSNLSSESTEPWFCEPCTRSVKNPFCELCPNTGGIFKETDTGRWVHMVCALYTRGVTFDDVETLSGVSLFELNYSLYGSKACTICEDRRLARSGICIGCDAGLCKTFFHTTCAQREGLLFESHSDEVDPYFAQCKQHADKSIVKKKRRTCIALLARLKRLQPLESCPDEIRRKLAETIRQPNPNLSRWTPADRPPIPHKVSKSLMTSPSLIIRLTKKSELMGLDPKSAFMSVQDELEMARQKWHIPPAFSLEFVAYCRDRTTRMITMKRNNVELTKQNVSLKEKESSLRDRYNSLRLVVDGAKATNEALIEEAKTIQRLVAASTGKQFNLPLLMEQMITRCSNVKGKNSIKSSKAVTKTSSTYGCGKCNTVKDQHLLSLCDTCRSYIHIYCLDPPLTRVPKKTKFGGWQCSDCSERDEEEQEEAIEEQNIIALQEAEGPRKLRERIKYPEKYCHESMMIADFWSLSKRKSKKSHKASKKIKTEQ